ncbi:MAG: amino acid synthesis family protein [Gordonia sp. (in: high G+C Gram-positive bacteria)]
MQDVPSDSDPRVRKVVTYREFVVSEADAAPAIPAQRATVAVVLPNPWSGTGPCKDLSPEVVAIAPRLAHLVVGALAKALGGVDEIEAFGKAAIVGVDGEIEHGGALIHTPYFGNVFRELVGGSSIICFADTRADAGADLVVPMWHKTHAATRSHYQTITARVSDAPRADEIVVVAAASTGPRPHARIGDRTTDAAVSVATLEGVAC